jgi:signal transduction histidine kinase
VWPSYNIANCFVDNLADGIIEKNTEFNLHVNSTLIMMQVLSFFECLMLVLAIYFIRNIQEDFSIDKELKGILFVWFTCNLLTSTFFIYQID